MLNKILFVVLFLFALNHKNKLYEGTMNSNEATICNFSIDGGASITDSNLKSYMFDGRCGTGYKYKIIKNCLGPRDKFSKDGICELCDRGKYGTCRATYKGGYCDKNGTIKDARGVTIDDPGRELGEMDEEDLKDHNPEKYNNIIKNECNPFKTDERDYDDEEYDDEDDEDDEEDDEDDDDIDKLYRGRRRRRGRGRRSRRRRNMRENNSYQGEYESESEGEYEGARIHNSNRRGDSGSIMEKIKENKIIVGAVIGIITLILILSVLFRDKLKAVSGKELKFLDSIYNAFKRDNNNGNIANTNANSNVNSNANN